MNTLLIGLLGGMCLTLVGMRIYLWWKLHQQKKLQKVLRRWWQY